MVLIYLLFICALIVWMFIYGVYSGIMQHIRVQKAKEKIRLQQEQRNELRRKQEEKRQQIITMITDAFAKIGWDNWSDSIHRYPDQYARLERALNEPPAILQYDKNFKIAKVESQSTNKCYLVRKEGCSCPDFKKRNIPCKHMYHLAVVLAECIENGNDIMSFAQDEYGVFYGLNFSLSGRGQDHVKKFILVNGGTYGVDSWQGISAVVNIDGKLTQKVSDAEFRNVPVFSPEQLMELFH